MPRLLLNPKQEILWKSNAIIAGNGGAHESDSFLGSLSIKSVRRGRVTWRTPDGQYTAHEGAYLVLNHGQTYNLKVEEPSSTFCVFFKPGLIEDIAAATRAKVDDLLEPAQSGPIGFYERLNPHNSIVTPILHAMHRKLHDDLEPWEADELYAGIGTALLQSQTEFRKELESLAFTKASTREEVHKRLGKARDYMLGNLTSALDLESVAAQACLSPFHFHRLFKQAFRQTPHDFLRQRRLERAAMLLRRSDRMVADVCISAGFQSLGSFCRLFKAETGMTPTEFRHLPYNSARTDN